ncbi:MAG: acyltransferase [Bacteroidota bacterium]
MNYIKGLDGVRSIAILFVILFHFFYVLECGWMGVQIFFVLSGYLITSILIKAKSLDLGYYLKRFYWRRVLRIFPLYYVYVLGVLGIYLIANYPSDFGSTSPYLFTYTYNFYPFAVGKFEPDTFFTHFWSLCIEEQFYLFWPFIVYLASPKTFRKIIIAVIILSPVVRYYLGVVLVDAGTFEHHHIGEIIYRFTPGQLDSFAFGAAIPAFQLQEKIKSPEKWFGLTFGLSIVVGILNLLSLQGQGMEFTFTSLGYPIGVIENFQHIWSYTLIGLTSASLIIWVTNEQKNKLIRPFMENKFMLMIGKISYGLYVYHWVILAGHKKYLHPVIQNTFLSFIVYFVIVFVVSYISYALFEMQFLKLKDKKFKLSH